MKTREVAFYARVSSEQQTTAQTIRSQVVALRQRILEDGSVLLPEHEFTDKGYSMAGRNRPANSPNGNKRGKQPLPTPMASNFQLFWNPTNRLSRYGIERSDGTLLIEQELP